LVVAPARKREDAIDWLVIIWEYVFAVTEADVVQIHFGFFWEKLNFTVLDGGAGFAVG
jgi:hypothetical protein